MSSTGAPDISETDIAIVGMSGRFPGARDVEEFWANVRDGVESLTTFGDDDLLAAGVSAAQLADPDYVKSGFLMPDMDMFDAAFFGLSPRDASIMDPQQRHFLELTWSALEHAGHSVDRFDGSIGIFAGCGASTYLMQNLLTNPELVQSVGFFLLRHTGNDKDFLSTRVSYQMNLRGPSVNVQTACSTSLVAIHLAAQSLLNGECDMALAGGSTVRQPHHVGYVYKEGEIMSPDGHCRPFDERSEGTVFGSGAGVVVLRRLADAIRDGDTIHAVIKGSAVNNDGSQKVGYLAPSVDGQAHAIAEAIAMSGVDAESVTYVEAHGTGTPVGDPIEIAALTEAFRRSTDAVGFCGIGSLKSNIGHLDTAAGVASVIKTVQALKHGIMPPSLHFERPNPALGIEGSPFYVNASPKAWPATSDAPRRAGVSALGAGGTNAHVVLEQAPDVESSGDARDWQVFTLSAKTAAAADAACANFARRLREQPDINLADAAYTLQMGRQAFAHRRAVVVRSAADGAELLASMDPKRVLAGTAGEGKHTVAFMFAGGGAQYAGMGADLYAGEPVFRAEVDACLALLRPHLAADLKALMYAAPSDAERATVELERPSLALPALFITQYALAKQYMAWGIAPAAMIGHSMGEYTAATLAGVFSLADAIALVALRGRLFETLPRGGMLSVPLSADELRPLLGGELSLAVINAPALCVASGPVQAIDALERTLAAQEVDARRIHINVAAHSAMLEPILAEFGAFFANIRMSAPQLPFVSNVTGTWITAKEATDATYWVRHLRGTVRFADGAGTLLADSERVLLEIGPGRTLATLARAHPDAAGRSVLTTMRHPDDTTSDVAFALGALGQLWLAGVSPDWRALHGDSRRRRIPLPTYPFEHRKHWIAPGKGAVAAQTTGKRADVGEWFYQPSWRRTLPPPPSALASGTRVLMFRDEEGLGLAIERRLREDGCTVIAAIPGDAFARRGDDVYAVRPASADDMASLVRAVAADGGFPSELVHCWNAVPAVAEGFDACAALKERAFHSLLVLAQALVSEDVSASVRLTVISSEMHQVAGERTIAPVKALLLGPTRVMSRELHNVRSRSIDVVLPPSGSWQETRLVRQLVSELATEPAGEVLALRGADRWAPSFESVRLDATDETPRLRERGTYIVTGGLGGIGLLVAERLAVAAKARLVLVGRGGLPARQEWPGWLAEHPAGDRTSRQIRAVQAIEAHGAEVLVFGADVADPAQMANVIREAKARFGAIHGAVHAAGVVHDAPIGVKTIEEAEAVLRPKVEGALSLAGALAGEELDFLVLFSSRGSIAGVAGQVDYAAANAFLDAFAHRAASLDGLPVTTINWSAWREVGMTAAAFGDTTSAPMPAHPLLARCVSHDEDETILAAELSARTHWLLDEHRIVGGEALIPGTGYLELARAAYATRHGAGPVELSDVFFVSPFVVHGDEQRELRVLLRRSEEGDEFVILGALPAAGDGRDQWQEHARGVATRASSGNAPRHDVGAIRARCTTRTQTFTGAETRREQLALGPRWSNVSRIDYGGTEALATLELPAAFAAETAQYELHPALLDVATACAQALIPGFDGHTDFYVPVGYAKLVTHAPLPARAFSHIRYRATGDADVAVFDVTVLDEHGAEVVDVAEFTMMRVRNSDVTATTDVRVWQDPRVARRRVSVASGLENAMTPGEGLDAFRRILAAQGAVQIIVSPEELDGYLAAIDAPAPSDEVAEVPGRPPLRVERVPEIETALESHEAVRQAVAVLREDKPGVTRLTAYIVWDQNEQATVSEIRRYLRERVREEQVPQHVLDVETIPLDAAGAVDHLALPDPFAPADDHVAPRSAMEKVVADIWRELLGVDRISVYDNFLDVGGHSLLAMRVVARIAKKTGARITQSSLNLQTLEQIAADLERRTGVAPPDLPAAATSTPPVATAAAANGNAPHEEPRGLGKRLFGSFGRK